MYETDPTNRRKYSQDVYDADGNWLRADVMEEDTCKVLVLQVNVLALTAEVMIGYGHLETTDTVTTLTVKRTHSVAIHNMPNGGRQYFKELCESCGGEDTISGDGILAFLAANAEYPDYSVMKVSSTKVTLAKPAQETPVVVSQVQA